MSKLLLWGLCESTLEVLSCMQISIRSALRKSVWPMVIDLEYCNFASGNVSGIPHLQFASGNVSRKTTPSFLVSEHDNIDMNQTVRGTYVLI